MYQGLISIDLYPEIFIFLPFGENVDVMNYENITKEDLILELERVQKQVEQELRYTEAHYSSMLSVSPDLILHT